MKAKSVVTAVLLAFVAVSVAYLVVKETGGKPTTVEVPPESSAPARTGSKIIAYYFHGNFRCVTCKSIEANTKQAIEAGFPEELENGLLEWQVVNVEESGNEHFIEDFQLTTRSVVIEEITEGKSKRWKNLQRVWELVHDKGTFTKYIQDETRAYLETKN